MPPRHTVAQAQKEIVDAILSYSPHRLEKLMKSSFAPGPDELEPNETNILNRPINNRHGGVYVKILREFDGNNNNHGDIQVRNEEMVAIGAGFSTFPLHIAVVCVYHAIKKDHGHKHVLKQALRTIDVLISHGADVHRGSECVFLLNMEGYSYIPFIEQYPHNRAANLAMWLKQHAWYMRSNETHQYLDIVMEKLDAAAAAAPAMSKEKEGVVVNNLTTKPVLTQIASAYHKLLFSEDYSDITFQCSDGISIPAHKAILAVSSDYFQTAFRGPWAENSADGIWQTSHSSKIMTSILTVLYTGSVDTCNELLKNEEVDHLSLFEISSEYGIDVLISLSVKNCMKSLENSNLKEVLQKAKLHSNEDLKLACFQYVKGNMGAMLTDPGMVTLATEDEELWGELICFLADGKEESIK